MSTVHILPTVKSTALGGRLSSLPVGQSPGEYFAIDVMSTVLEGRLITEPIWRLGIWLLGDLLVSILLAEISTVLVGSLSS